MNEKFEKGRITRLYWNLFEWFAAPGQRHHAVRAFKLHSLLFIFAITQLVMLLFALLAPRYVAHNLVHWGPWLCIFVSWFALFAYRHWKNLILTSNIYLLACTSYVSIFIWLTDGFKRSTYLWLGLVPVVAGILTNRRWATAWTVLVLCLVFLGCWANYAGLAPNYLLVQNHYALTAMQQAGFLTVMGALTNFLLYQQKVSSDYLREKTVSKQNLLRILVHDISTPLSVMRLTGQLLSNGIAGNDTQSAGLKIERNGERIANIIHLIRDLEKWEANHTTVPAQPLELVGLLDQVVELYQNRLSSKNINIAKFYASEVYVLGHETMLIHQIFGNILSNAIKFSHEHGRIDIAIEPRSAHTVAVLIRDYGIGIPKQTREDLFDPLATTTRKGTLGETGTGFGLPITRNCVQLLGGNISVYSRTKEESPDDFGTNMEIILRRAPNF